jgi:hypothetical protein
VGKGLLADNLLGIGFVVLLAVVTPGFGEVLLALPGFGEVLLALPGFGEVLAALLGFGESEELEALLDSEELGGFGIKVEGCFKFDFGLASSRS